MAAVSGLMLYRNLLRRGLPYWRGWVLIVAVTLASTGMTLLQPWPMQVLVDDVLGAGDESSPAFGRALGLLPGGSTPRGLLLWVVVVEILIFGAHSAADAVVTLAWVRVGQRMVYDLAAELYARIQRRSLLFHSHGAVGDCISRIMGDSWSVYTTADHLLFAPGHALVSGAAVLMVMLRMDSLLALLALAVAPCMATSSYLLGLRIRALAHARREIESSIQSHVQQTLTGIPVVQAFAQESREQERFREFTEAAIRNQRRGAVVENLGSLASGLIVTLGTGVILWIGSHRVQSGALSVGSLLVFLSYLAVLQAEMGKFIGTYSGLQSARAGMERVMQVLSAEPEVGDLPESIKLTGVHGHIRLENVTFGYEPGRPVLRGLNLEVMPGQTVAIVGATGAGKSTLVGLVPRFFDPWEGRVTIDGQDLREVQLKSLRSNMALVLQEPFLFPLTIAQNIAYGRPDASREQVVAAAQAANADAFIECLPNGYDTLLGERGGTLSGGERQRLSIARALLKDAPILILDEPTSALDVRTESLLLEALERLMKGRTTLIIAHRLSTVRNADRIVVLDNRTVAEQGTHEQLLALNGQYARLYGSQGAAPVEMFPAAQCASLEGDDAAI